MLDSPLVRQLVRLAIEEDLGGGDITTSLTVAKDKVSEAEIIAREDLIMCGGPLIEILFAELKYPVEIRFLLAEGASAKKGERLAHLVGSAAHLLSAERMLLNFLQRLCGVASFTKKFVEQAHGLTILDTRKTMPGWRVLDKYAVAIGGAKNHRFNLSDIILIKNNHIDIHAKGLAGTLNDVLDKRSKSLHLEVEVRNFTELEIAITAKPNTIMLDNMSDEEIGRAVSLVKQSDPNIKIEASGGITIDRLKNLSKLGVDFVSIGALTTKAPNVDISLRLKAVGSKEK